MYEIFTKNELFCPPSFLTAMEERARERMNRKKALEEKKRKAEEEKLVKETLILWLFTIYKKFPENLVGK